MNGTKLYNREILPIIEAELDSPYAVFILGSRRVGKTTLLKLLQNRLREI